MFISRQKKEENIAEYILYMWQIEDIMRSCNFDLDIIERNLINEYSPSDSTKVEIRKWYENLIKAMQEERIVKKGHLQELNHIMFELNFLHNSLINIFQDKVYIGFYNVALPNIQALQQKNDESVSDIETCLIGLYGLLLLQIQKKPVSPETTIAMKTFSKLLAYLSKKYQQMKTGELEMPGVFQN